MDQLEMKIEAARYALEEVRDGMRLGLGSGSTSAEFVRLLGEARAHGDFLDVRCTCTSGRTETQARSLGIPVLPLADLAPLDLAVDGADALDEKLRLIKGGGGALLREKIVEQAARRFVVIADETKLVPTLSGQMLPVEVTPFAVDVLRKHFASIGLDPVLRARDGQPFVTDEGNRILDIRIPENDDIEHIVAGLRLHAGVVETGFFPREASEAIIAGNGGVRRLHR